MGSFRFTTRNSRLTMSVVSTNQNWKRVRVFLSQKTVIERYGGESSFLFPFLPTVQLRCLSPNTTCCDTSSTPIPVNSMSTIFMFLFLLSSLDSLGSFQLCEFMLRRVLRLHQFLFRHPHEILQFLRCHHLLVPHLD